VSKKGDDGSVLSGDAARDTTGERDRTDDGGENSARDGGRAVTVDPELTAIGNRYQRRKLLVPGLILLVAVVGGVTLHALLIETVPTLVYTLGLVLSSIVVFGNLTGGFTLATDKSPERVREEFTSPESPFIGLSTGTADEVRVADDTVEMSFSMLWRSWVVSYGTRVREDGAVEATVRQNGPVKTVAVTIGEADGRTSVDIERVDDDRTPISVWKLLAEKVKHRSLVAAWRVQGYELVDDRRSIDFPWS